MQLERFDVDTGALKEPAVERIFQAWVEDWEEEARKNNDCVAEACLLTKYKGLVFNDPDSGSTYIFDFRSGIETLSFVEGEVMDGLWLVLVADKPDDESCNEPFSLEMACELIGATRQKEGVKVLKQVVEEE